MVLLGTSDEYIFVSTRAAADAHAAAAEIHRKLKAREKSGGAPALGCCVGRSGSLAPAAGRRPSFWDRKERHATLGGDAPCCAAAPPAGGGAACWAPAGAAPPTVLARLSARARAGCGVGPLFSRGPAAAEEPPAALPESSGAPAAAAGGPPPAAGLAPTPAARARHSSQTPAALAGCRPSRIDSTCLAWRTQRPRLGAGPAARSSRVPSAAPAAGPQAGAPAPCLPATPGGSPAPSEACSKVRRRCSCAAWGSHATAHPGKSGSQCPRQRAHPPIAAK